MRKWVRFYRINKPIGMMEGNKKKREGKKIEMK
jgi:hypothetical protein